MNQNQNEPKILADLVAEDAVLGALSMDPQRLVEVASILRPEDFYRERNGWVYAAMLALHEKRQPIDTVTLGDYLERQGRLDLVGGYAYLTDISYVSSSMYAEHYARSVADYATRRRIVANAQKAVQAAYDLERDVVEIVDEIEKATMGLNAVSQKRAVKHIADVLPGVLDAAEEASRSETGMAGLPIGYYLVDRILGGLRPGNFVLLAGATGMGKTAFAINVVANVARQFNAPVGIFSLEMSDREIAARLLSMESAVPSNNITNGWLDEEDWSILVAAVNTLRERGIFLDDTPSIGLPELRSKARRLVMEEGVKLIVVDYLQLMGTPSEARGQNREQQVAAISRGLKGLARELGIPIIALSQLNQDVDTRQDKRPTLGDIRESKAPGHDADIALFVYRDDYYNPDSDKQNIASVIIAKNRGGSPGEVSLYFRKELMQFTDLEVHRVDLDGNVTVIKDGKVVEEKKVHY